MRNRSYTILALAALAFAGCSKVEELNSNPDRSVSLQMNHALARPTEIYEICS